MARAAAQVIDGGNLDAIDELYAPGMTADVRAPVAPFLTRSPDVRMDTVTLVGDGDTVV